MNTVLNFRDQYGRPESVELTDDEEELLDKAFDFYYVDEELWGNLPIPIRQPPQKNVDWFMRHVV